MTIHEPYVVTRWCCASHGIMNVSHLEVHLHKANEKSCKCDTYYWTFTECLGFPTCKMGLVLHLNFYWHHSELYLEEENPPSHGLGLMVFLWIWHSGEKKPRKNNVWQNVVYTFFIGPCNPINLCSSLLLLLKWAYPSACSWNREEFLRIRISSFTLNWKTFRQKFTEQAMLWPDGNTGTHRS